jgi:hypothetical protein
VSTLMPATRVSTSCRFISHETGTSHRFFDFTSTAPADLIDAVFVHFAPESSRGTSEAFFPSPLRRSAGHLTGRSLPWNEVFERGHPRSLADKAKAKEDVLDELGSGVRAGEL